ncbi:MAG TPA: hypothetical protein PK228_09495 [Saprospiraceae bacterium]|nr:hypothetical protein [Saprospiraceae bacterium]
MDSIKSVLSIIVVIMLTACMLCNIAEIWLESEVFYKLKYTFVTLFLYASIIGFLIQVGENNQQQK